MSQPTTPTTSKELPTTGIEIPIKANVEEVFTAEDLERVILCFNNLWNNVLMFWYTQSYTKICKNYIFFNAALMYKVCTSNQINF